MKVLISYWFSKQYLRSTCPLLCILGLKLNKPCLRNIMLGREDYLEINERTQHGLINEVAESYTRHRSDKQESDSAKS